MLEEVEVMGVVAKLYGVADVPPSGEDDLAGLEVAEVRARRAA